MSSFPLLHDHKEFKDLLEILSQELSIQPQLVEKDYWLMHCLFGLNTLKFNIELKGGTSLSKGFRVIDRFSEDIDIKIEPPAHLGLKAGPNHNKAVHIELRGAFFNWLRDNITIPGIISVERDTEFDDTQMRSGGIRLIYQSHYAPLPKLKVGILLEVGFDRTTPNQRVLISSWAYERAMNAKVSVQDNRAFNVPCYLPEYTFVEKLQAISTKFRQQQEKGPGFPPNFLRHYYDVYQLLGLDCVQRFIGSKKYYDYKDKRFRGGDNRDIASNDAFTLSVPATRSLYEAEYKKGADLYFRGQVPFNEILKRIKDNITRL
ncbi:MAG: nucleotidyl transferase AbiEii/AbiGii toxin family protein [Proteobacteria bacterium]|nr:nucleotidyl transferase AbiEii/AbiGii toxin family protein [Pseudomonadota bacterium]NDC22908.1 nucleotidyl transferase AbiEii/AbiGii toxin family protein [Pseudomonadota bacterium]NDD04409.1 nucleotidyl transferase AbiEii/AbiGii toxin family protein [Pseudomonadota bacterium]NDG26376.1 nucleotidyl transferase AbiEii/AbiGii toxin family protein [Pseudomonadota bacterium]